MRPARKLPLLLVVVFAVVLFGLRTTQVLAYPPPGSVAGLTSNCSSPQPGQTCTITFCINDANGMPVANQPVTFSSSNPNAAHAQPSSGTTGVNGCVQAAAVIGPGCGVAVITGNAQGVTAQTTINVTCPNGSPLPFTAGSVPVAPVSSSFPLGAVMAVTIGALALLTGGVLLVAMKRRSQAGT
jgi:hypothetical protein